MSEKKQRFSLQQKMDEDEQIAKSNLVESPPFPKDLLIETTNACNHRCVFCAQPKMTRTKKVMPKEKVVSILQEARKLGAEKVGLYSGAEPLADKNLIDYIKITKALGYTYIYISTNGAIGKNDKFKEIIDAGLDSIKFSFNAGTRESYKIVHGRDDWDQVVSNIRFVSEYRKKK
ncbi:MAG: radical SAM protein [Bacteroidia bacterium]|nr:radical SAM protein [Bacteroidia bacterium]